MLRQAVTEISVPTQGRGFYEITREIAALVAKAGFEQGVATIHIQHTSASLIIQENAELEEIETELARKFSSSVYVVQPCNIPGTQLWEMQTYRGGKRTPEADFKVRAFKTSYGISTQSV